MRFYANGLPIMKLERREHLIAWLKDEIIAHHESPLAITNYEKLIDGQIPELRNLAGLICDESSILKSGGGVIKWNLIKSARGIEYKLSCTATPAPNDIMEYASQAAFLEKLRTEGEILWTFFSRDKKGNWRIKPHAEAGFYRFLASWSIYLRDPAHYGWADNLSNIPAPEFKDYELPMTDAQRKESQRLFHSTGAGLFGDKRLGVRERSKLSQLAKGFLYEPDKSARRIHSIKPQFIAGLIESEVAAKLQPLIWTVFDEESELLAQSVPHLQLATLTGKTPAKQRLEIIEEYRHGRLNGLISKASMLGFGMNFQHCGSMIFSGWDDSYERFYQAIRRAYRYGQTRRLRVHIPYIPELEGMILDNIFRKQANFNADAERMERYYFDALNGLGVVA